MSPDIVRAMGSTENVTVACKGVPSLAWKSI
jgi:hypothetical protein